MKNGYSFGLMLMFFVLLAGVAAACTDFQVKATDGTVVIGRSMEFAMGMDSDVVVVPRPEKAMVSMTPDGKKGISWTPKYGYLGVNAFGEKEAILDGLNEAGLAVEFLWFTESQYQEAKGDWLAVTDLSSWLLGNFSDVEQIKKALPKLNIVAVYVPQLKRVPGFHVAVHDAKGNNIVIEFINGKTNIYDNPIGVMTNKPSFDWQLTNLRNYVNLDSYDRESVEIAGVKIDATGSGTGWLGMPGDWSPPSRLVRTVHIVHSADPARDASGAVNLAEHVLNAVDIPQGVVKAKGPVNKDMIDYTQWIVIKDLTNKVLYFRSYQDLALKKVDMKKLSFKQGAEMKTIRIEDGSRNIIDVTAKLK